MTDAAITDGKVDRRYKLCRCAKCRQESICTPDNDFYTLNTDTGPLFCESCLLKMPHDLQL